MAKNDLAEAAGITETEVELRAALALEQGRREGIERSLSMRPAAPPPPREEDYLEKFQKETNLGPEHAALLDRAVDQRIRGRVGPVLKRLEEDREKRDKERAEEAAFEAAMAANPDVAAQPEKFAAAVAAAQVASGGKPQRPGEFMRAAVGKFRELFPNDSKKRTAAPAPDYVEGASSPGLVTPLGGPPVEEEKPKGPSRLQTQYGDDENDIIDLGADGVDPNAILEEMTKTYAEGKNGYLEDKGMRTFMPAVARPLMKRRKAKRAAAAAAAR